MPSPGNPQTLNRYAYTLNNPLKYVDPSGYCATLSDGSPDPNDQDCWDIYNELVAQGWDADPSLNYSYADPIFKSSFEGVGWGWMVAMANGRGIKVGGAWLYHLWQDELYKGITWHALTSSETVMNAFQSNGEAFDRVIGAYIKGAEVQSDGVAGLGIGLSLHAIIGFGGKVGSFLKKATEHLIGESLLDIKGLSISDGLVNFAIGSIEMYRSDYYGQIEDIQIALLHLSPLAVKQEPIPDLQKTGFGGPLDCVYPMCSIDYSNHTQVPQQ